jgi:type I restriction enzyme M protein
MTDSATFTTPGADEEDLGDLLLEVLPGDGSTIGNQSAREALSRAAGRPTLNADLRAVKQ